MRKISIYFDESETLNNALIGSKGSLLGWLVDNDLPVINIIEEFDFDIEEAFDDEDDEE